MLINIFIHAVIARLSTNIFLYFNIMLIYTTGKRILIVDELANQMARIMDQKDELIKRLQQPFVGEYLEIEAAYHRCVSYIIKKL